MEHTIGSVIKQLRGKKQITQEELAAYLHVSAQSVSKWESNTANPDIAYIPQIAGFFGVTTDYLFGLQISQNRPAGEIISELQGLFARGQYEALVISCNKILEEDHLESELYYSCLQHLCYAYSKMGRRGAAEAIARRLPRTPICQDLMLEQVLEGEELKHCLDANLEHFLLYLWLRLGNGGKHSPDRTLQDRIRGQESARQLYELVFYDGQLGVYSAYLAENERQLVRLYTQNGDLEKAMESLKRALQYARMYQESFSQEMDTESIFLYNKRTSVLREEADARPERYLTVLRELAYSEELEPLRQSAGWQEMKSVVDAIPLSQSGTISG
ncbi:MAG: helix-turn-helix transcriptional regulator [bacterium]|nr:helix-turn-helix transcriptional regulator [bacterium]MCM1375927.1 helix-turn-helix transcriptional regulator [Muribaculum sp.]